MSGACFDVRGFYFPLQVFIAAGGTVVCGVAITPAQCANEIEEVMEAANEGADRRDGHPNMEASSGAICSPVVGSMTIRLFPVVTFSPSMKAGR